MSVAAVDVGTNTVRLLVVDGAGRDLERAQRITRLGRGVDAGRTLGTDAVSRTVDAVRAYVERAQQLGANRIRIVGTSALRDAANADAFAAAVHEATGLAVEVLDGETEGRTAYAGVTSWLPPGDYVVCDIGGGSTELITADKAASFDVGSVRIKERFCAGDPPSEEQTRAARSFVGETLAGFSAPGRLVGVAGTITTLAALVLGLSGYESDKVHGSVMPRAEVDAWTKRLLSMPSSAIAALGPVQRGREDVIGPGSLILSLVMQTLGAADVLVSERDILDGLVR